MINTKYLKDLFYYIFAEIHFSDTSFIFSIIGRQIWLKYKHVIRHHFFKLHVYGQMSFAAFTFSKINLLI